MPKKISNPVTNGKTPILIFLSTIFLFIVAIVAMLLATLIYNEHLGVRITLGSVSTASVSGICYSIKSYFDTRSRTEKDTHKLAMRKLKNKERHIKRRYKHKERMTKIECNGNKK